MITLIITMTGKPIGQEGSYSMFDEQTKNFENIKEAKEYLKETYGKCKRVPMYCDTKDGKIIKTGYIYCFRNSDISHTPVEKWTQQDWVSFQEITIKNIRM